MELEKYLTAEILGELGDITRFDSPKEIIAFVDLIQR